MRLLIFFLFVFLCKQGNGVKYECDTTASCGCSTSSTILTRIVGGENAADWSWSWAVSLRYYGSHFCGASILSPSFVITAGHCVAGITSATPLSILAGSTTLTPSSSNPFYQIRSVAQIYKHSAFSDSTLINDIAILRLSTPLDMTTGKIKPICLPSGTVAQPSDNINMTAVGWGVTSSSSNKVSPNLLQVTVQSISSTVVACKKSLSDSRWQFCAGLLQGGKDTCQGDSGGPLMAFINGLWQLHGLTSYGQGCAVAGFPGIYTRVSAYVSWIQNIIGVTTVTTIKTTTTTKKLVTITTTKKPITTTTKKRLLTTSKKSYSNFSSELTSNETDRLAGEDLLEGSVLQTSNSAKHSTVQSLFVVCLLPIITGAYSFIL